MRYATSAFLLILLVSASGAAQDTPAAFVGGSVSAANMESRTELAYTGSFGYRFTRVVSFMIEATAVPDIASSFGPGSPVIQGAVVTAGSTSVVIYPGPVYSNPGGRIVLFTNAARIDISSTSARLMPFFIAGGGVANVRRTADFGYGIPLPLAPGAPGAPTQPIRPGTERVTSSSTELALTLGGGLGVRLASSVWLDADLRVFRLMGDDDRNLGRFGVGVRYVF